eukprot:TRINITY_DN64410_c0_g1_i1.p1 TRINITY_DN64410_c0_g1~~TRINITY_DN64410_c0_g1_i1.p1  ORF type:complete len:436 (-),score=81.54 TRINITY_DN64410_c0_g1_i1:57-1364(-)
MSGLLLTCLSWLLLAIGVPAGRELSLEEISAALRIIDSLPARTQKAIELFVHLNDTQIQQARDAFPESLSDFQLDASDDGWSGEKSSASKDPDDDGEFALIVLFAGVVVIVMLPHLARSRCCTGRAQEAAQREEEAGPAEVVSEEVRQARRAEALERLRLVDLPGDASIMDRARLRRLESSLACETDTLLRECSICCSENCRQSSVHGHDRICASCMRKCVEAKLSSGLPAQCPQCCQALTLAEIAETGVEQREFDIAQRIVQGKIHEQLAALRDFRDVFTEAEISDLERIAGDGLQRDPATAAYLSESTTPCPSCSAPCARVDGCPSVRCRCGHRFEIAQVVPGEGEPRREQQAGRVVLIYFSFFVLTLLMASDTWEDFVLTLSIMALFSIPVVLAVAVPWIRRLMARRRERALRRALLEDMHQAVQRPLASEA